MAERWMDRVPDAPGGIVGAWFNVVFCGALVIGLPVIAFTSNEGVAAVLFAIGALLLTGFLEATFIHKLRSQIEGRRELRRRPN
ncbi:hypothetical protein ITJ54_06430 [Curtobacterium sp. VKM Ac-2865]|uniref:hypothetical protein n=1 Tax=Curtobacterium sp. VKM Ac-2865 TaxID=2783817 RepID=UPI00188CFDF7|nr:hypothetical protein [Curtobacterium sp. VKM Ac-2865]MBF4582305.1 hypothetical protein [Curtobacterium sp. VKM Ac-2865]